MRRLDLKPLVRSSFPVFALTFAAIYGAFGTESPFFPSFLSARGLSVARIGVLLSMGMMVRLVVGPWLGLMADAVGAKRILVPATFASGTLILLYLPHWSFWPVLVVSLLHATAIAPLGLTDALAIYASERERVFSYGWVRGVGSASFVGGTLASGILVAHLGLRSTLVAAAVLFLASTLFCLPLPATRGSAEPVLARDVRGLVADRQFSLMLVYAGLLIGSHAFNDTFAVLSWRASGIQPQLISFLWSESVLAELAVFFLIGPALLRRWSIARCALLAAVGGLVRWSLLASSSDLMVLLVAQSLHGLSFSLAHLTCMRVIVERVPERLAATAQMGYGTVSVGLSTAVLTLFSGSLYAAWGVRGFWIMAGLCVGAAGVAIAIRSSPSADPETPAPA
jgi:MFS transporter, PPP family, 3-phenylpropionic acid transporter